MYMHHKYLNLIGLICIFEGKKGSFFMFILFKSYMASIFFSVIEFWL